MRHVATHLFSLVCVLLQLSLLTDLTGWVVERHVKHVRLLPGAVGTQDVVWVLHGVHQNHHLMMKRRAEKQKRHAVWEGVKSPSPFWRLSSQLTEWCVSSRSLGKVRIMSKCSLNSASWGLVWKCAFVHVTVWTAELLCMRTHGDWDVSLFRLCCSTKAPRPEPKSSFQG